MRRLMGVLIALAVVLLAFVADSVPQSTMAKGPAAPKDGVARIAVFSSYFEGLLPWLRVMDVEKVDFVYLDDRAQTAITLYVGRIYGYRSILVGVGPDNSTDVFHKVVNRYNIQLAFFSGYSKVAEDGYDTGTVFVPEEVTVTNHRLGINEYILGLARQVAKEAILLQCPSSVWLTTGEACLEKRPKAVVVGSRGAMLDMGWANIASQQGIPFLAVSVELFPAGVDVDTFRNMAAKNSHSVLSAVMRGFDAAILGADLIPLGMERSERG